MYSVQHSRFTLLATAFLLVFLLATGRSQAADQFADNTTVVSISVNGAADSANPGTACMKIAATVPSACSAGYISIPNNNKQLVATALMAKSTGSNVWVYYSDAFGSNHCPGRTYTPCSVISIEVK